jgi:hypothetical protein
VSVRRPPTREPDCIHRGYTGERPHPASACRTCKDGPQLAEWHAQWDAWLAENPDSDEAKIVARMDATGQWTR